MNEKDNVLIDNVNPMAIVIYMMLVTVGFIGMAIRYGVFSAVMSLSVTLIVIPILMHAYIAIGGIQGIQSLAVSKYIIKKIGFLNNLEYLVNKLIHIRKK